MSRCIYCGKSGLFLKLNSFHQCAECEARSQRQRVDAAQRKTEQLRATLSEIDALELFPARRDGAKVSPRSLDAVVDLKYSSVTKRTPLSRVSDFVVVDVETTGLTAKCSIVEVAAMRFDAFCPTALFSTFINPCKAIPASATEINHITDDMVAEAPTIWEIMPSLIEFVGRWPLVGHNLPFDLKFLYRAGFDVGEGRWLYDTIDLAGACLKKPRNDNDENYDVENYRLDSLCEYYNITDCGHHRARMDCLATGKLFTRLVEDITGEVV